MQLRHEISRMQRDGSSGKCQFTSDHLVLITIPYVLAFCKNVSIKSTFRYYGMKLAERNGQFTFRGKTGNRDNTDTVKNDIKEAGH